MLPLPSFKPIRPNSYMWFLRPFSLLSAGLSHALTLQPTEVLVVSQTRLTCPCSSAFTQVPLSPGSPFSSPSTWQPLRSLFRLLLNITSSEVFPPPPHPLQGMHCPYRVCLSLCTYPQSIRLWIMSLSPCLSLLLN